MRASAQALGDAAGRIGRHGRGLRGDDAAVDAAHQVGEGSPISTPTTFMPALVSILPAREARLDQPHQLVERNCHESERQDKRHQGGRVEGLGIERA